MRSHGHTRANRRRLWADVAWPVLAGLLAAVGAFGASVQMGFAEFLEVSTAVSLFFVSWVLAMAFSVYHEIGRRGPRLVRVGLAATVVAMALFGLAQVFAGFGLLAAAAVAVTSPPVTHLLARLRRPVGRASAAPPAPPPVLTEQETDQEMVDRELADIVAGLSELDDHFPEP